MEDALIKKSQLESEYVSQLEELRSRLQNSQNTESSITATKEEETQQSSRDHLQEKVVN